MTAPPTILFHYITPILRNKKIQNVRDTELPKVVSTTVLEVNVPSCPMDFAITKELTVVADPNIIKIATNF